MCWLLRREDMSGEFRKEYIEMLGVRPQESEVRAAEAKLKGADRARVRAYVCSFPEFRARYSEMIRRVFAIVRDAPPDEATISFYLKRFARPGYGPDELSDDITLGAEAEGLGEETVEEEETAGADDVLSFARRWKSATGRKIDIHEFALYFRDSPDKAKICLLSASQDAAHAFADRVHRDYLGRGMTRDEFLEEHLADHDKPHFQAEAVAAVLASDEYRLEMMKLLEKSHLKLFGVDMHPEDLEHAFFAVRDRGTKLCSEGASEELLRLNDEMREVARAVNEAYNSVLGRPADAEEVRECVSKFRAVGAEAATADLVVRLHESLEFHDVIKDRFRKAFEEKTGRQPKTREVYDALAGTLQRHAKDMTRALADFSDVISRVE